MKKFFLAVLVLIAAPCLVFSGGAGEGQYSAVMGSSSLGGTWYPTAARMAGAAMEHGGVVVTVQSSGGGTENVRLMRQNQYQMGLVEPNIANYAFKGIKLFKEDGAYDNLTFVTNLYPNAACAVVHKNGPIKTMYDYNMALNGGKKYGFAPGSPGSGDDYCWEEIFASFEIPKENMIWKPLSHTERVMAFKDKVLEGIGYTTAQPSGSILEASALTPIRILEISGKDREKVMKDSPWYIPAVIPAGTYNGQDEEVQTISIGGFVMANKDVPEDFIYRYLSGVYGKGLKDVQSVAAATKDITLENAPLGAGDITFHPGAIKFYKEKGVIK
ncbi:MAG: TAXI family TRAP transporter solute-binding subunit [Spirochaetia bacterium]|jgi:TRAP transporter TAXI family solute receptor|nr:TAXI family TRAP transporter solute-binding subunit [Spirochaetia bacterium]